MKPTAQQRRAASPSQVHARKMAEQQAEMGRRQIAVLAQLECLRGLPEFALETLAPHGVLRAFSPGTTILSERAASGYLYLVLRGSITLTLRDRSRREVLVGMYSRGDCFGEGPLFGDLFRGAQVKTATTCYLLQLPLDAVRAALDQSDELDARLRAIYRRHLVASTLGRVPIFGDLSPVERGNIARLLTPRHYERGTTVITQGHPGSALYLIEAGQCTVERNGGLVAHLDEGAFFGEISLLTGQPHNADVRALTPLDVLELPRPAFNELLARNPAIAEQIKSIVEQRLNAHTPPSDPQLQLVGSAVERGWLRGTHLLVRDPRRCADECRTCIGACATRHGVARLRPSNQYMSGMEVLDSCRQCRVGAECVEACPEHAIQWNNNGALIITDACSGCGACVTACPYDAITIVDLPKPHQNRLQSFWQRLAHGRGGAIPLEPSGPTQRADKCNYCHGYDDLACVSACPHGAIRLVPVEELFPL